MKRKERLVFKRPRRYATEVAQKSDWETECGQYRIVRTRWKLECMTGQEDWLALFNDPQVGWKIISHHRKKQPAIASCQKHANQPPRRKRMCQLVTNRGCSFGKGV